MKILHLIDKSFMGGGQVNVRNLIEGLRILGVEIVLSCRDGGPLVEWVRALGVPVRPIPFDKVFRPGPARAITRIAREERVDLVHGHGLVATTYAVLARLFFGLDLPLLYQQHGFHHRNYGSATLGFRKASERFVCRRSDLVIASSASDRNELVTGGYVDAGRVVVLLNGIPEPTSSAEERARVLAAIPFAGKAPIVGVVSRLHVQKGIDVFLRAAARIRESAPETRFVVVGTGELEAEMHGLARELDLGDVLVFTGTLPSRACHPHFDVAVLCSRWEGLPITLLEYMAMARPIVVSALDGCLGAVGPEQAEIVPPDDPAALADAILRLLRDPALSKRRGAAARARFESTFTLPVIAAQYLDLYRKVIPA